MRKLILNRYLIILLGASVLVAFATITQGESSKLSLNPTPANPYLNPYEARSYPKRLEVFRDGKHIGVIRSEKPNIERWGFIDSGRHIVVKSRGDDGPAIIELFDTATCMRVSKVEMFSHLCLKR